MKEYYTTKEVADKLNIKTETVTYYIRKGELEAIHLGGGYRITEDDLQQFIDSRRTKSN